MLVARWVLVLLLAIDLIGSPFHAHHHEGGPDGYATHAVQWDSDHVIHHQLHEDFEATLHADEAAHFGHSLSALRSTSLKLAKVKSPIELPTLAPPFALTGLLTPLAAAVFVRWQPGRERVPISLFRTVPPDGRAPPFLHV